MALIGGKEGTVPGSVWWSYPSAWRGAYGCNKSRKGSVGVKPEECMIFKADSGVTAVGWAIRAAQPEVRHWVERMG